MHRTLEFLLHHGYVVLLGWVFAEQAGLPLPSMPILLAAGALAGMGHLGLFASFFCVLLAAVCADFIWYCLGRAKGIPILQLLCRISLEPDSCVRRTESVFARQGARSLLFAKFVPGLNAVTPPLAGVFRMPPWRFLLFDGAGIVFWAGTFLGVGYAFSDEIERLGEHLSILGGWLLVLLAGGLGAYIAHKYIARRRFMRELRVSRITAEELREQLDAGEPVVIVDLRHALDFEADPEIIPGALRIDASELEERDDLLPRDREVVLYCT